MKLKNNTGRDRVLRGPVEMYSLPARGEITVSSIELEEMKRHGNTRNWLHKGYISVEEGEAPVAKLKDERDHPPLPEGVTGEGLEIHHHGAGWYSVYVDGMPCTDAKVRKEQADEIAKDYE